jgi:hypothetical protein
MAIYDVHRFGARLCRDYAVLRGDSRQELASIDETELAVFSPPYPNSFDYTDVYNVELWSPGHLDSSEANLALRNSTLRSHAQIVRDMSGTSYTSTALSQVGDSGPSIDRHLHPRRYRNGAHAAVFPE